MVVKILPVSLRGEQQEAEQKARSREALFNSPFTGLEALFIFAAQGTCGFLAAGPAKMLGKH